MAIADVMITVTLVRYLAQAVTSSPWTSGPLISKTDITLPNPSTDLYWIGLIRITVETGAVTSTGAVLALILYLRYRENNIHLVSPSFRFESALLLNPRSNVEHVSQSLVHPG